MSEYNPNLNRFLTRDLYNGALGDMTLGTDPWNTNRYMFGGGNPVSRIELSGHMNCEESAGGGKYGAILDIATLAKWFKRAKPLKALPAEATPDEEWAEAAATPTVTGAPGPAPGVTAALRSRYGVPHGFVTSSPRRSAVGQVGRIVASWPSGTARSARRQRISRSTTGCARSDPHLEIKRIVQVWPLFGRDGDADESGSTR